ncbi:MAG: AI-2E family transporter [Gammaproteobacteria bacterium]|nr:AI-2E family transporter [Gammaproteobacteria bacterium]MDH5727981.1 AI-2E family transporter [Gammaproteobacteria bacterium]
MIQWILDRPIGRAIFIYTIMLISLALLAVIFSPVLIPLLVSFLFYSLLQPLTNKLLGRGFSKYSAISLVLIGLVVITVTVIVVLFPFLLDQIAELQSRLPSIWKHISAMVAELGNVLQQKAGVSFDPDTVVQRALEYLKQWGASTAMSSASSVMTIAMTLMLVPLITFFLLKDYQRVRNHVMSWLPNRGFELGWLTYYRVTSQLQKYLRGVMIQSLIVAMVASIGFWLIGVDMPVLFGVLTGLFNLIPYVGPLLAIIPPLIIALGEQSYSIGLLFGIPAVVLTAQLIDNLVVIPAVIANTVNLHPLVVLLGIVIFGAVFGFIGMLIAIPAMSVSKIVFNALIYGLQGKDFELA